MTHPVKLMRGGDVLVTECTPLNGEMKVYEL